MTLGLALALLAGMVQAASPSEGFLADVTGAGAAGPQWMKYTDAMTGAGQSDGVLQRRSENGVDYLHVQGQLKTGFMFPFMGFQTQTPPGAAVMDWSAHKGVRFTARGDGKVYRLNVLLKSVRDHDEYGAEFVATKDWKVFEIPFSKLTQLGFGRRVKWDSKTVGGIGLHVSGGVMPFAFDLRNVSLY
jgi:hypothetical protein